MRHLTDEELVEAYVTQHDQVAFRTLVERHQERIYGYLLGMVRSRELANDLFQETFLKVIAALNKQRGSYTSQGKFLGWVMRIARNATLDHLRSRKRWTDVQPQDTDEGEGSYWDRLPDTDPLADELLHHMERGAWLDACIQQLPPEQREVLLLRHETDLTFREIADLTECSINTALGRMRYALLNLRKMMVASKKKSLAHEVTT